MPVFENPTKLMIDECDLFNAKCKKNEIKFMELIQFIIGNNFTQEEANVLIEFIKTRTIPDLPIQD